MQTMLQSSLNAVADVVSNLFFNLMRSHVTANILY